MSAPVDFVQNQVRQLAAAQVRETLRDRRNTIAMIVTFSVMSLGVAVLDLAIAGNTDLRVSDALLGVGLVASSLPLLALIGFINLAFVGTAVPLSSYRARGVLRHWGTTPAGRFWFVATFLLPRLALGIMQILTLTTLAVFFAPTTPGGLTRAVVLMGAALVCALAVGALFAARSHRPDRLMALALVLTITSIATSGAVLPFDLFPDAVGAVLGWLPTTVFVRCLSAEVFGRQPEFLSFAGVVLMLVGLAWAFMSLAIRAFQWDALERAGRDH